MAGCLSLGNTESIRALDEVQDSSFGSTAAESLSLVNSRKALTDALVTASWYASATAKKKVQEALSFATQAHQGQTRADGSPYATHPIDVATMVAKLGLSADAVCAALLHDVSEDCGATEQELAEKFNPSIASMVQDLSKLASHHFSSRTDREADALRRLLQQLLESPDVVIIKLADRLHNSGSLHELDPVKGQRIASQTLDIHAPMALRMGLYDYYSKMSNNCLRILYPWRSRVIEDFARRAQEQSNQENQAQLESLSDSCKAAGFSVDIQPVPTTLKALYRRIRRLATPGGISSILGGGHYNLVLDGDEGDVYRILGMVHAVFQPIPGGLSDYIASPKLNDYRALHTHVRPASGKPILFILQTQAMHQISNYGIAVSSGKGYRQQVIQELVNASLADVESGTVFMNEMRSHLLPRSVMVYTSDEVIHSLPKGSTALDLSFLEKADDAVYTSACKVDGQTVDLGTVLRSGNKVSFSYSDTPQVQRFWLRKAITPQAQRIISVSINQRTDSEARRLGYDTLRQSLKRLGTDLSKLTKRDLARVVSDVGAPNLSQMLAKVGRAEVSPEVVAGRLTAPQGFRLPFWPRSSAAPLIAGAEGLRVTISRCCLPLPGDSVMVAPRDRGSHEFRVHCVNCPVFKERLKAVKAEDGATESDQALEIELLRQEGRDFLTRLEVQLHKKIGALASMTTEFAQLGISIEQLYRLNDYKPEWFVVEFRVVDKKSQAEVIRQLRRLTGVRSVARAQPRASQLQGAGRLNDEEVVWNQ